MKTKKQILLFASSFIFFQNMNAQPVMFKGGAILYNIGYVLDFGLEMQIKDQIGLQFSIGKSEVSGEGLSREKFIISPQIRYYLKKNAWRTAPYLGLVLQTNYGKTGDEIFTSGQQPYGWESTDYNKIGLGLMLGKQGKIYKRLGFDMHIGGIGEIGKVNIRKEYWSNAPPNTLNSSSTEKNKTSIRPFATFNLYLILGELTKTEKITKNTEGSF